MTKMMATAISHKTIYATPFHNLQKTPNSSRSDSEFFDAKISFTIKYP